MALLVAVIACAVAVPVAASGAGSGDTAKISKKKKKKKKKKAKKPAETGGPVAIAGIDVEDGGPGGHGPILNWQIFAQSVISKVQKTTGAGILVIGGGKSPTDQVTEFWNQIGAGTGQTVTYANGAGIATANFDAVKVIAVASSEAGTSSGLTQLEQDALNARAANISDFIDNGGGLLAFSQTGLLNPYAYIAGIGGITPNLELSYDNIAPTAAGLAVGITDSLDICCWHDTYLTFPSFLQVLATDGALGSSSFGQVAALGGDTVVTTPEPKKKEKKKKKKKKKKPTFTG